MEQEEKDRRRREIVELQKHYGKATEDKAAYERMVDELTMQEGNR